MSEVSAGSAAASERKVGWPVWAAIAAIAIAVFTPLLTGWYPRSAKAKAAERYEMVVRNGTSAERCAAAEDVREAHLAAGDDEGYQAWRLTAQSDCEAAQLDAIAGM